MVSSQLSFYFFLNFIYLYIHELYHLACGTLFPQLRIESMFPELEVQSLNPGPPGKPASPHFTDEEIEVQSGAPSSSGVPQAAL